MVGTSGSGKSTLARQLAQRLGVDQLELDSVYHQADWQPLPAEELARRVREFVAADGWVVDGNYRVVRPIVWARAQVVVWLDLPRLFVFRRLIARTLRRAVTRTELWNGNHESLTNLLRGGDQNLLLWAWRHHAKYRDRYSAAMTDPANADLRFVHIRRVVDAHPDRVLARILEHDPNIGRTDG